MRGQRVLGTCLAAAILGAGLSCTFNVDLGAETLFPTGSSFVLRGTAENVASPQGACNIWRGTNGVIYHLFQGTRIDNADFDRVITPGVTSRLEIATRSDLVVDCQQGTIVEVRQILEIQD